MTDDKNLTSMGERIADARECSNLTTAQLSRRLGVQTDTITDWQRNASQPRANRLAMLAGVLGLGFLAWLLWATVELSNGSSASKGNASLLPWVGRAVLICGALHVALLGWDNWFAPDKWGNYGHLPPIKLLSFVTAVVFLILRRRSA